MQQCPISSNGALKWRYQTDCLIDPSSPAIGADGTVYVGSDGYYFYAIHSNGSLKWKYPIESPVASPTIAKDGTIYIGGDEYVHAIGTKTFVNISPWSQFHQNNFHTGRQTVSEPLQVFDSLNLILDGTPAITGSLNLDITNYQASSFYMNISFDVGIDLKKGLVAYYPFNGNANDESGNSLHGTVYGATLTTDRFGRTNRAYNFDGVSSYIKIGYPVPPLLQIQNSITLSTWIYVLSYSPTSAIKTIVGCQYDLPGAPHGRGTAIHFDLRNPAGHVCFQIGDGSSRWRETNSISVLPLGQWVHVVATRCSNEYGQIYFNGILQSVVSDDYWNGAIDYSDAMYAIGMQKNYVDRYFNGNIDDVRIYNRSLNADEILALYQDGITATSNFCVSGGVFMPDASIDDCGVSGFGDDIVYYCCNGIPRYCLSKEPACYWNNNMCPEEYSGITCQLPPNNDISYCNAYPNLLAYNIVGGGEYYWCDNNGYFCNTSSLVDHIQCPNPFQNVALITTSTTTPTATVSDSGTITNIETPTNTLTSTTSQTPTLSPTDKQKISTFVPENDDKKNNNVIINEIIINNGNSFNANSFMLGGGGIVGGLLLGTGLTWYFCHKNKKKTVQNIAEQPASNSVVAEVPKTVGSNTIGTATINLRLS